MHQASINTPQTQVRAPQWTVPAFAVYGDRFSGADSVRHQQLYAVDDQYGSG
jgi:hypothetical protein